MQFNDVTDDGQPESKSGFTPGAFGLREPVKDVREELGRYTYAIVRNFESETSQGPAQTNAHLAAFRREFHGVGQ